MTSSKTFVYATGEDRPDPSEYEEFGPPTAAELERGAAVVAATGVTSADFREAR